jgi:uncharacterized protein HemX
MQPPPEYSFKQKDSKIPLIIVSLLLVAALAFGIWAFGGRQDYKNNVDKKIAAAVAEAKKEQATQLQAQFEEQAKSPYKTNVLAGTRFDGAIGQSGSNDINGSMLVIKVRDKTLQISTQTQAGVKDFDNIILPALTFVP